MLDEVKSATWASEAENILAGNLGDYVKKEREVMARNINLDKNQLDKWTVAFSSDCGDVLKAAKMKGLKIGKVNKDGKTNLTPLLQTVKGQDMTWAIKTLRLSQTLDEARGFGFRGQIELLDIDLLTRSYLTGETFE